MKGVRRQLSLLGTTSGFRLLFFATLASSLGTLLATVALVVDVKDRTDSGPWVGALMFVEFLPAVVVGLFFGVSELVRFGVFGTLPFASSATQIVVLAGIAGFTTGFFRPAVYAGLPNLVAEHELAQANSLIQTSENVSWTLAPIIGGAIVAASSPDTAYWVNAASFLLSALLIFRIAADKLQGAFATSRGHLRDLADGFARVVRTRPLLTVLVVWTIALGGVAASNTAQGRRLQLAARAARREGRDPRPCLHRDHERQLCGLRRRRPRRRAAHRLVRPALGVRGRRRPADVRVARRLRARPERRGDSGAHPGDRGRVVRNRRDWTRETLAAGVRAGDKRALARAITLVENSDPLAYDVVRDLYPETGAAYAIGITGPPGVGKSSLISALIRHLREEQRTIGVISVDPSSPFSQGALLGDRIRLADHFLDPEVFIRSMGTRGHLGGLAEATLQALLVLDAAGKARRRCGTRCGRSFRSTVTGRGGRRSS